MRYTPSGQAVTNFSVATNRQYTANNGERVKETTWFRVSSLGKQAEACNQYLRKGSLVYIEGRLTPDKATGNPRVWTGQDGVSHASFEVSADMVKFLSWLEKTEQTKPATQTQAAMHAPDEDEIPF